MCKVMIVAGAKDSKNLVSLMKEMGKQMTPGNKDGLGYAAVDSNGDLFGERWLDNYQAFLPPPSPVESMGEDLVIQEFDTLLKTKQVRSVAKVEYNSFGNVNLDDIKSVTLHTRMATSSRGMQNTHPFVAYDTSVIHNGIIRNDTDFKLTLSTCDSEAILQSALEHKLGVNPDAITGVASSLVGYYVAAMFNRDAQGNRVLDIFKANNSNFVVAYVKEIGTFVFTTSELDLIQACKNLGFTASLASDFKDGIFMRLNPFTGKIVEGGVKFFEPSKSYVTQANIYYGTGYNSHTSKTHSGYEYNSEYTGGGNIIDVSSKGNKGKNKNITKAEIEYMKLTPSISKVSEAAWRRRA
jgi:hypothetical protein